MQGQVFFLSLVVISAIAAVFLWVAMGASSVPDAAGKPSPDGLRRVGFWGLILFGVLLTYVTLSPWPHAIPTADGTVTVNATGSMWSWDIDKKEVPVETPVVFRVTSHDVNHGFGVTDPSGAIVFQTQAMPGYINQVAHTFSAPGTYEVICLEYCGLAHHDMREKIEVVAKK